MKREKLLSSFYGFLIFFLTNIVTVTVAIMVFVAVNRATEGNTDLLALVTLAVIIGLAGLHTAVDYFRRKYMVDKPVEEILLATQKIAEGDFSYRLDILHSVAGYDNFDVIKENLNKMAAALSKSEILKNDFISSVSHEIKTPLAIIKNYTQLLAVTEDPALRAEYCSTVVGATERLGNLVTNILKLNRLENHEITPDLSEVRLQDALAEAVIAFEDRLEAKNIEVDCELDEVSVYSSESYLEIVWNNLLSNAVKFTPVGGKISVRLSATRDGAVVEVSDTGIGISPEEGARIFDKFYQADRSHASEGNGLGLALVKKVISILGGEISVRSAPGEGSTFTVRIRNAKEDN